MESVYGELHLFLLHMNATSGALTAGEAGVASSLAAAFCAQSSCRQGRAASAGGCDILYGSTFPAIFPNSSALSGTTDAPGTVSVSGLAAAQANQNA